MKQRFKLMLGDNIQSLKKLPDNSVDSLVSDPPYGLSFMNKKWDYDVPSVEFWKEVYRVLKPGGYVLSFCGTRTYHRMVVNIEDAGFEIRDQIMWLYAQGFPKSHNIGKAVDKLQGNERVEWLDEKKTQPNIRGNGDQLLISSSGVEVKDREPIKHSKGSSPYEGWGTALKPANEPICVARKPLSEKSVALNVLKWGTGGINIDGCRVGSEGGTMKVNTDSCLDSNGVYGDGLNGGKVQELNEGRFPANIIFECICDEVIKGEKGEIKKSGFSVGGNSENSVGLNGIKNAPDNYNDKGDIHTNPNCSCRLLDEQSGVSKSTANQNYKWNNTDCDGNTFQSRGKYTPRNDKGGASRFFYNAKVSKKERNMGLDGFEEKQVFGDKGATYQGLSDSKIPSKNSHPTVKPVSLMAYLCRLVTPEGGIVLDPFMGSGSTGISALLEGFRFVGMEMDPEYMKIAEARIENYEQYRQFIKK